MDFTEKALVLQVGRFREADMWVRFFSPSRGLLTAFAFGGCQSRRRFCGCLDALNQVLLRVKSNRAGTYLCLMEGSLLQSYPRLRTDWKRLGMAVNCLKFFQAVPTGSDGTETAYRLLLDTLETLNADAPVSPLFPLFFRARMTFDQGYGPDLTACSTCGRSVRDISMPQVCVEHGHLACEGCCPPDGLHLSTGQEALDVIERVRTEAPSLWERRELSPLARRECARFVDAFIAYHVGLVWERGQFIRN